MIVVRPSSAIASVITAAALAAQEPEHQHGAAADRAAAPPAGVVERSPIEASLDIMTAAGASTARNDVLRDLQGGHHDPKQRGFTLQQAELALTGTVHPHLEAQAYLVALIDAAEGETIVELEEACVTTRQLPHGLQVKAGTYFTEFGRVNAQHPHQWDWQDQPVIHSRLFGGDGLRGPGLRLGWTIPGSHTEILLGVQNASGETMTSFLANEEVYEERPIGGRAFADPEVRSGADLVYAARVATSWPVWGPGQLDLGASAVFGPNATGSGAGTGIVGLDAVWSWRPPSHHGGLPSWRVQAEFLARDFDAAAQSDGQDPANPIAVPAETLRDHGGYLQVLHGSAAGLGAGVRVEWASGSGANYDAVTQALVGRDHDPYRADRVRISPLLVYAPSTCWRIRAQYNYDSSDHLDDPVHSVWFGVEILIGTRPSHTH